jgi:hypothetical protein
VRLNLIKVADFAAVGGMGKRVEEGKLASGSSRVCWSRHGCRAERGQFLEYGDGRWLIIDVNAVSAIRGDFTPYN